MNNIIIIQAFMFTSHIMLKFERCVIFLSAKTWSQIDLLIFARNIILSSTFAVKPIIMHSLFCFFSFDLLVVKVFFGLYLLMFSLSIHDKNVNWSILKDLLAYYNHLSTSWKSLAKVASPCLV